MANVYRARRRVGAGGAGIADVAGRAGVSIATVSRVLSPSGHSVSAATQERVRRAAAELDYAPSSLARALATGSSRIVGVLVGDSDDPHVSGIIRGAEEVGTRAGYLLFVGNTERRPERELSYVRLLRAYRADGLLFFGGGMEDQGDAVQAELAAEVAAFCAAGGVVVATTQHRLPVPRVAVDSEGAAYQAAAHLLDLGHRRIGLVAGPSAVRVSHVRNAGFGRALEERGLTLDPRLVAVGDLTRAGGERAAGGLLDLPAELRPTALCAANDLMAIGALGAARMRGVDVPGDLSVVGLGDIPLAGSVCPPLTTVHFPLRQLGAAAMETLLAALGAGPAGAAPTTERRLPATLVVRESTGPPGGRKGKRKKGGAAGGGKESREHKEHKQKKAKKDARRGS